AAPKNRAAVPKLLALAETDGLLVQVEKGLYLHAETMELLKNQLLDALLEKGSMTLGEIRELFETSRKYAVPICEYFDRIGLTERRGDDRVLKTVTQCENPTENA
ncbi:MAG: SelB C-terminal domain-containing protein, partial [Pirellulales bacterium]|nr:SelB C-terminal domain-containing protein [Pirellulales bacterium]